MNKNPKDLSQLFKALGDENRLKMLLFLSSKKEFECKDDLSYENQPCIKDLAKSLNITLSTISHHIKELMNADLIIAKKRGRSVYCSINKTVFSKLIKFLNESIIT